MQQRKQSQPERPISRQQSHQQQRQAARQENHKFASVDRGEALNRALDMQARQLKEIQRRQGQ